MTGPRLEVDTAELTALAGQFNELGKQLQDAVVPMEPGPGESGNTYHFYRQSEPCGAGDQDMFKPLPDQSKISLEVDGSPLFTCAAKGTDLVACIANDENHGFVLRPSGSWTF